MSDGEMFTVSREFLDQFVDSEDCAFDHNGGCKAHEYPIIGFGDLCPQAELKLLLASGSNNG